MLIKKYLFKKDIQNFGYQTIAIYHRGVSKMHRWIVKFTHTSDPVIAQQVIVVHVNIIIYAMAYWFTQPILPFLAKGLGADPIVFGYFQTCFSIFQLLGGPVIGQVCDTSGPRSALVWSQAAAATVYGLLGGATSLPMLFISQIPTLGLHSMQAAQACLTQTSSVDTRASSLGQLSLSYGLGMVCGSALGGVWGERFGFQSVALLSMVLSLVTLPLNMKVLPDWKTSSSGTKARASTGSTWRNTFSLMQHPKIREMVVIQLLLGLGLGVYRASLTQSLALRFQFTPAMTGQFMATTAALGVFTNVVVLPTWIQWLKASDRSLLQSSFIILGLCLFGYSFTSSTTELFLVTFPLSMASSIVYTVFSSVMTKVVEMENAGTSIALAHASRTICGIVSPTLAGVLLQKLGFGALGSFGAFMTLCATLGLMWTKEEEKEKEQ